MLSAPCPANISRPLPSATGATVAFYTHSGQRASIVAAAMVLHGNTINSIAPVLVTLVKLPNFGTGAPVALTTITMANATAAGQSVAGAAIAAPGVVLDPGDVVRATVTDAATVAGGDLYVTLGLLYS